MNIVASPAGQSVQSQQTLKLSSSANVHEVTDGSKSQQGDTVTISAEGKQLASALTVSKVKVAQNLQDAMVKQKNLTAKIAAAKEDGGNVGGLNAQLADVNKAISKDRTQSMQSS